MGMTVTLLVSVTSSGALASLAACSFDDFNNIDFECCASLLALTSAMVVAVVVAAAATGAEAKPALAAVESSFDDILGVSGEQGPVAAMVNNRNKIYIHRQV